MIVGCNDQLAMREYLAKQINEAEKVHVVQVLKKVIEYQLLHVSRREAKV